MRAIGWEICIVLGFIGALTGAGKDMSPTYSEIEHNVLIEPYVDGGAMMYDLHIRVERNCRGSLRRYVQQNGKEYYLGERSINFIPKSRWRKGELQTITPVVDLRNHREALKPGPATYHVYSVMYCNMVQFAFGNPVEEKYPPVHFNIIDPEPSG